jgi:hypothetical protein
MQSVENPSAPPVEISDREFERYAQQGYATTERDGQRIVHVPDAIYEATAKALDEARATSIAIEKRRARERNRRRERSKQRRLAKAGR